MKHETTIAPAGPEDLDALVPLFDAYRQFYRQPSDEAAAQAFLAERLAQGDSVILLARGPAGQAIGFTQLYPMFSSVRMRRLWVLNDLFVRPEARRSGVARALMEAARAHARRTGAVALTLATEKDNLSAKRLYEALGYRRDDAFDYYELSV